MVVALKHINFITFLYWSIKYLPAKWAEVFVLITNFTEYRYENRSKWSKS